MDNGFDIITHNKNTEHGVDNVEVFIIIYIFFLLGDIIAVRINQSYHTSRHGN